MIRIYKTNKTQVVYNYRQILEYRVLNINSTGPSAPDKGNREELVAPPLIQSTPITILSIIQTH